MSKTIEYYNNNAEKFIQGTIDADVTDLLENFLKHIPEKGSILDAGCGSGRDSLYFMKHGYVVSAFDASIEMVKYSSKVTGLKVIHSTYEDIELDKSTFDGIWANASLLHVSRDDMLTVIKKLFRALKTNGIIFLSYKYGHNEYEKNGRYFNSYTESSLILIVDQLGKNEIVSIIVTSDVRPNRQHEKWLNCLVRKL